MPDKCCGCCQLRTGIIVVGVFSMLIGAATIIAGSLYLSSCDEILEHTGKECYKANGYFNVISGIISFAAGAMLLAVIFMNVRVFLIPYCILIMLVSLGLLGMAIYAFVEGFIGYGFFFLIGSSGDSYFAFLVFSYKKKISAEESSPKDEVPSVAVTAGESLRPKTGGLNSSFEGESAARVVKELPAQ